MKLTTEVFIRVAQDGELIGAYESLDEAQMRSIRYGLPNEKIFEARMVLGKEYDPWSSYAGEDS